MRYLPPQRSAGSGEGRLTISRSHYHYAVAGGRVPENGKAELVNGLVRVYRSDDRDNPTIYHSTDAAEAEHALPGLEDVIARSIQINRAKLVFLNFIRTATMARTARNLFLLVFAFFSLSVHVDAVALKRLQTGKEVKRSYKGVSFQYNTALAGEIRVKVVAQNLDGKPGDVVPRHIALDFIGYQMPHPKPFSGPPAVQIFPIDSYRSLISAYSQEQAKSTSPPANFVPDFDDQITTLKNLLVKRPSAETIDVVLTQGRSDYYQGKVPLLPMYDVCEPFRSHFQYLTFKNGSGVAFVTQYTIESTLIVNQALSFNFQGLTADGKYYVAAQFPIAAPFLPHDFSEELAAKEGLNYDKGMFNDSFRKSYDSYITRTAARIDALSVDEFRPALPLIVSLLRSLQIEADLFSSK